ncbi:unnamed protein product [Urochloa decumbens]|uniref:F-box/LRR-repeat protein 15/At3g58940/PEG3-like LRR domain-containing protein n=1 Tax=Urochloa decumbens TaxID=240449 RepID=A0ABC9BDM4_9POAL
MDPRPRRKGSPVPHPSLQGVYLCGDAHASPRRLLLPELTHLTLHSCFLPTAPPTFSGFPKLTWLSLTMVGFGECGERDLEAMIHKSPLLEMLELEDVWILGDEVDEWVIQAPNLRSLTFVADDDYELQIGELPSLQEANVTIQNYNSVDRDFVTLLTRFAQVRELEFHMPLAEVNVLERLSCSFQILKRLVLHTDFCNVARILSMFSLLRSAPNLQQLETKIVDSQAQNDEVDVDFFSALCTNGLFTRLKIVTITDAPLCSNEMHFIEFILSEARLLCALFVYQDDDSDHAKPSEEAVIQLTKFRRVSPKARVFFRNMDVHWRHEISLRNIVDLL